VRCSDTCSGLFRLCVSVWNEAGRTERQSVFGLFHLARRMSVSRTQVVISARPETELTGDVAAARAEFALARIRSEPAIATRTSCGGLAASQELARRRRRAVCSRGVGRAGRWHAACSG